MNRIFLFLLTTVLSICLLSSCTPDITPSFQPKSLRIVSFTPSSGAENSTVVITGEYFSYDASENQVSFNGTPAEVIAVNSAGTELTVRVPFGATTGKISVALPGQTPVFSATDFTVNPLAPVITSITPDKGDIGTAVEIAGSNFRSGSSIFFNGTQANATVVSSTKITAIVPAGATTGKVKVVSGTSLEAISPADFYVHPTITGFTPTSGKEGNEITITGTNFSTDVAEPNVVYFGTIAVPSSDVQVISATELKVKVPTGLSATAVKIFVEVKAMRAESTDSFTPLPDFSVTGVTPMHGQEGSEVTISGTGLNNVTKVLFGTHEATIKAGSTDNQLVFYVPAGYNGATDNKASIVLETGSTQHTVPGTFEVTNVWKKVFSHGPGTLDKRSGYMASFTSNGIMYWGFGVTNGYRNDLFSYDIATSGLASAQNQNPSATNQPAPRSVMNSTVIGNKAYIFGGFNFNTGVDYNDIWEYNMTTNTFTKKMSVLPTDEALGGSYYSFAVNGKLYVYMYGNNIRHNIYEYDHVADDLSTTPFMTWVNTPSLGYSEIEVIGNMVYFIASKRIVALNMTTKTFTEYILPSSVQGINQRNFIHFNDGSKIYIGGGFCSSCTNSAAKDFYVFDPATGTTTRLADVPQLDHYKNPVGVKDGKGYVLSSDGLYQYIPNR